MSDQKLTPPLVYWAQRRNLIYLNIALEDTKNPTIKIEEDKVYFHGVGGTEMKEHEVTIELSEPISVEESRHIARQRNIEFVLIKKTEQYWTHLLKDKTRVHWLKVDFNKWRDEDESDEEADQAGGSAGMGGMGGAMGGGPPGAGNFDFEELMAKMGSNGGMAGQDFNVDDNNEEDSDDEALPGLE